MLNGSEGLSFSVHIWTWICMKSIICYFPFWKLFFRMKWKHNFFSGRLAKKINVLLFCSVRKYKRLSNDLSVVVRSIFQNQIVEKEPKICLPIFSKLMIFLVFMPRKFSLLKFLGIKRNLWSWILIIFTLWPEHCAFKFPTFMILYEILGLRSLVKKRTKKKMVATSSICSHNYLNL